MHLGILKETKVPVDRRVPLVPEQCRLLNEKYSFDIEIESSENRSFSDQEYKNAGVRVVDKSIDPEIMLGVKEISIDTLIEGKTYMFFSHTIKKQAYNRDLLKAILNKRIRLIDYECLTDKNKRRIVAFGRYAGIVGAYNGIWTYGQRYNLFNTRRAYECFDLADLKTELKKINLPPISIIITGGGRVTKGAMETLMGINFKQVSPYRFLNEQFNFAVFAQLNPKDYNEHTNGSEFSKQDFYNNPANYKSTFQRYYQKADILIAAAFWDPVAPPLFTKAQMLENDFNLKIIADITCDIDGSIPSTKKSTTIHEPLYDYNAETGDLLPPFSDEENVTVMAIDNLPCELPRDASMDFGDQLANNVLPNFLNGDQDKILERGTITQNGELTNPYLYLSDFVIGK